MTIQDELDTAAGVADAAKRVRRVGRNAEITLSNGIVLGCRAVPPLLGNAIQEEFPEPQPPTWHNPEKDRDELNESDPDYQREHDAWEERNKRGIADLILILGTWVISVPEGYYKPEEDGWIERLEVASKFLGKPLEIKKDDEDFRYIAWLRLYALETLWDITLLSSLPGELANVTENEVLDAMAAFRGLPERNADRDAPDPAPSPNGDRDNRAARRSRARDRGA